MKNLIPTIIIALAIISCSCDSTEPPIEIDPPGRRDYTWSVDTLKDNFLHLWRTWGSSSKDVWVVGGGSTSDGVPLYHYDGEKWEKPSGSLLVKVYTVLIR